MIVFLIGALGWLVHMNATTPRQMALDEPEPVAAPAPPATGPVDAAAAHEAEPLPPLVLVKGGQGAAPPEARPDAAPAPRLLVNPARERPLAPAATQMAAPPIAAIAAAPPAPPGPSRAVAARLAAVSPASAPRTFKAPLPRTKKRKAALVPEPVETDSDVALLTALIDFAGKPHDAAAPGAEASHACTGVQEPGKRCVTRAARLLHVMRKTTD